MPDNEEIIDLEVEDSQPIDFEGGVFYEAGAKIHVDTTEHWNAQKDLIGEKNHLYVYSDYVQDGTKKLAGVKAGDGKAYLIDTPFIVGNTKPLEDHVKDETVHITEDERLFWNNKVTCFLSADNSEQLVFTKEKEEPNNG